MGKSTAVFRSPSNELRGAVLHAVDGNKKLVTFPGHFSYQSTNVGCNLEISLRPFAIAFPRVVGQIQALVAVAAKYALHVQARSGGHSYGNHSLGGADGALVIDLKHFGYVELDPSTWIATIGGGTRLEYVTKQLYVLGHRAMAHGTCPSVGIGGHATIGGLGPTSRMWGATLDHIVAMKVVLADARVVIVSSTQDPELFFALRGAGSAFGIIVEFKFRTHAAPDEVVQFSHSLSGPYTDMTKTFKEWQDIVQDPHLTRKLFSQVTITKFGMTITGTYFGSETEFRTERMAKILVYGDSRPPLRRSASSNSSLSLSDFLGRPTPAKRKAKIELRVYKDNWLGLVREWAGGRILSKIVGRPSHFYHKSLSVPSGERMDCESIDVLFSYIEEAKKGTSLWFVIMDMCGGAVNDIPTDATAFPHRSIFYFLQSYAISMGRVSEVSKHFVRNVNDIVEQGLGGKGDGGVYPGYVDPELKSAQHKYWGANLEKLEKIKTKYDPNDVFHNPQSVRPNYAESSSVANE